MLLYRFINLKHGLVSGPSSAWHKVGALATDGLSNTENLALRLGGPHRAIVPRQERENHATHFQDGTLVSWKLDHDARTHLYLGRYLAPFSLAWILVAQPAR